MVFRVFKGAKTHSEMKKRGSCCFEGGNSELGVFFDYVIDA